MQLAQATKVVDLATLQSLQRANYVTIASPPKHQQSISSASPTSLIALTSSYAQSKAQPLNAHFQWYGSARPAVDISKDLRRRLLSLYGTYTNDTGTRVDYAALRASPEFAEYTIATSELQCVEDVPLLPVDERKAFFINIYNSLIIHAKAVNVRGLTRLSLFDLASYQIGEYLLTANDIEHGILRSNTAAPTGFLQRWLGNNQWWRDGDPRVAALSLPGPCDARVHFALNCGANSCPAIRVYDGGNVDFGLDAAARAFVGGEVEVVDGRTVRGSKILQWYRGDFARGDAELVRQLAGWAGGELGEELVAVADDAVLEFRAYDWGDNDESG